ncbi:MAG TPA: hypothetical protein VKV28_08985 [Candidatus Binataceae bacterium]|nr:hypothetical protein [Candidatus Binataceae bacterium]
MAIREVLLKEWDPIGVQGIAGAENEYDPYVGRLYVMLMQEHATAEDIAAYLLNIATDRMDLALSTELAERGKRAAAELADLRPRLPTH